MDPLARVSCLRGDITAQVKALLPRVWEVAEVIMAANPGIED